MTGPRLNPQALYLLKLIAQNPDKPGTWDGFAKYRESPKSTTLFRALENQGYITYGFGWRITAEGDNCLQQCGG